MADQKFKTKVQLQGGVSLPTEAASRAVELDASGNIKASAVTSAELAQVSGVTSPIQTQLTANATSISDHIADSVDAHDASAISSIAAGNLAATDVQSALNELQSDVDSRALDSSVIKKDGSVAFTAAQSMGGFKLTSLADPTTGGDAVNLQTLQAYQEGLKPKAAVRVATVGAGILSNSFENGEGIDGLTLATGDRILIKNQASPAQNGIYVVQESGAPVRASDFDSISPIDEINGAYVPVQEGTVNAGKFFVQSGSTVSVVGTDAINFVFFNSAATLTGGQGITITGNNIEVDHDGEGLTFASGQLSIELDGATLAKSAAGLRLENTSVTPGTVGSASDSAQIVVDQQGRITSILNVAINISSTQVSDFVEAAQDAVGTILTDTTSIDLTYDDAAGTISAVVLPAGVDHNSLLNFEANKHIDHSAVSIATASGTSGLSGGGDITATRNITIDIPGTTALASTPAAADSFLVYDDSASALKKVTYAELLAGVASGSTGDISETSFSAANNQTAAASVTGLAFAVGVVRSFKTLVSVTLDATIDSYEVFELTGINKGSAFDMSVNGVGDESGVVFTITSAGQVQYKSANSAGFVSNMIKFRAETTTV